MEPTSIQYRNEKFSHPGGASIGCVFVALFPGWLWDITSKSIEKSESGPLEPNSCIPIWDLVGGLGKRSKNWIEEDGGEMVEEFYPTRPWIETRQGWVKLRVRGFEMRGTRAAVPHSVRAGTALLNRSVVDKINEGIADIVVDRDCEPQRWEQLWLRKQGTNNLMADKQ